jgi:hypothetical protein
MPSYIVIGKVYVDATGAADEMPILMTEYGPATALIEYCITMNRSVSWMTKLTAAAKRFWDYLEANPLEEQGWRVFRNFARALRNGTISPQSGIDPSGLYWMALNIRDAGGSIRLLSDFFDWISRESSDSRTAFNPKYSGNTFEQRFELLAYRYRRSKSFLGHSWNPTPSSSNVRMTPTTRPPTVLRSRPPMFPEERFDELLDRGFRVGGKPDYRGMLITLLQFGGGIRVSEAFHLYIPDVQPHYAQSNSTLVTVHHPTLGIAPDGWINADGKRGNRSQYLAARFGLVPRHRCVGGLHAGWKNPALDEKWYLQVHWFPEEYGIRFGQIWTLYLEQIANIERSHPYAWINLSEKKGDPYKISKYERALERAVNRIGLEYGKVWGTSAHGGRHAYGQRAKKAGIHPVIIQRILHHASIDSQLVYTQPEKSEISEALTAGAAVLRELSSQRRLKKSN